MPDFGKSVFICSKPLQVLNCCSIARKHQLQDSEIHLITSGISDAKGFLDFIKTTQHLTSIKSITPHNSYRDAVSRIRESSYESLFIEDDRVSLYHLLAPLKRRYLSVFEEGFGTYLGDFPDKLKGLRKLKWKLLSQVTGCGFQFGDGRKTDFVLVQFPETYNVLNPKNAKKTLPFPGVIDEITQDLFAWERILKADTGNISRSAEQANLILGTWGGLSADKIEQIRDRNIATFYKAHPHDGVDFASESSKTIRRSWIPAEACISVLSQLYASLEVYHLSSSASFYCGDKFQNVKFIDLLNDRRFMTVCSQKTKQNPHDK